MGGVNLNRIILDEEFDALVEGGCHRGRLFAQQNLHRVAGWLTEEVLFAFGTRAALTVGAVGHVVCTAEQRLTLKMWQRVLWTFPAAHRFSYFCLKKRANARIFACGRSPSFLAALCYKLLCFERKEIVIRQCFHERLFSHKRLTLLMLIVCLESELACNLVPATERLAPENRLACDFVSFKRAKIQ